MAGFVDDHQRMRRLIVILLAFVVIAVPASAAGVDPKVLVLSQVDVPAGFRLDRSETGVRSNATEARNDPRLPALFRRWGRVTGYESGFDRGPATIGSRADVFRSARGAGELVSWFDREVRKAGMRGLRRGRVEIGAGGWLYRGPSPTPFALVVWREGRVFAGVVLTGASPRLTLTLARTQQRRIVTALR